MRLLILTQKVDKNDSVLGFFHRWLEEFAKNCEKLTVICLYQGSYNLPSNVRILSLGKEDGSSKWKYIFRFYKYIWQEHKNYDKVFVHMNQEYVLLGSIFWRIFAKKIIFWRNHPRGNFLTKLAVTFSHRVFCTSNASFVAKFQKTLIMPAGNDARFFKPVTGLERKKNSVCMLGRISAIKHIELALEAINYLIVEGHSVFLTVVGPVSVKDKDYYNSLSKYVIDNNLTEYVSFVFELALDQHPKIFSSHIINLNLTETGSFDKTILGGISCGALPLVSNKSLSGFLPSICITEPNPISIAAGIIKLLALESVYGIHKELDNFSQSQSLEVLFDKLFLELNSI